MDIQSNRKTREGGDRTVVACAPSPEDLIVSKLARLNEKDEEFVAAYHLARPLDLALIKQRLQATRLEPDIASAALAYIQATLR